MNMKTLGDPLIVAALETQGSAEYILKAMSTKQLDPNNAALDNYLNMGTGFTPLLVALYNGAFDVANVLLDNDANVRVLTGSRDGALQVLFQGMHNRGEGRTAGAVPLEKHRGRNTPRQTPSTSSTSSTSSISSISSISSTSPPPPSSQWLSCMQRLVKVEHELANVQNERGLTPLSLAMHFVQLGPVTYLFQLLGISSMATIDTHGKNPMFHLLDGLGTPQEKCLVLNHLAERIGRGPETEALVACRVQPSSVNSMTSTSTGHSSTRSTASSNIVSTEHPLSFLNQGTGETLLHHAISLPVPDANIVSTLLDHSGFGSSSLLHLADSKEQTAVDRIRMRASIKPTSTSSLTAPMVMACLMVIETHLDMQEAKSQQIAAELIVEEEQMAMRKTSHNKILNQTNQNNAIRNSSNHTHTVAHQGNIVDGSIGGSIDDSVAGGGASSSPNDQGNQPKEEKSKQKRRKRRSKRARRRQRLRRSDKELLDEATAERLSVSMDEPKDEPKLSVVEHAATERSANTERNAATLLDLMMANNIAPSRPFFPNNEDDGVWLNIGPRGGILNSNDHRKSNGSGRHQFSSPPQRRQQGKKSKNHNNHTNHNNHNNHTTNNKNHQNHHNHQHNKNNRNNKNKNGSTLRAVSPIFEYSGGAHNSSLTSNGSLSSLDSSVSPASSQAPGSPPSPGFVLSGGTHNAAHNTAHAASTVSVRSNDSNDSSKVQNDRNVWASVASGKATVRHSRQPHQQQQQQQQQARVLSRNTQDQKEEGRSKQRPQPRQPPRQQHPRPSTTEEQSLVKAHEIQAQHRLVELFPLASAVDVRPAHLVPVRGTEVTHYATECSGAQLDLMEKIHRNALDQITMIRMERTRQSTMDEIAERLKRGLPITRGTRSISIDH